MISFEDLMKGFGVVTVMNACIYKLMPNKTYSDYRKCSHNSNGGLMPDDFECTHLYLDALKISNLNQEGANKIVVGGQNHDVLMQYGKTMTLEMNNALGSVEILQEFFGCEVGKETGALYVTNKFPGSFAIEGDTFFIHQQTGNKVPVKIFIPNFRPKGVFNLIQDSDGEAAVFDCSGTITATSICDRDYPEGHDVFYLISDKSWTQGELTYTPATLSYAKINTNIGASNYINYLSTWSGQRSTYNNTYIVTKIANDGEIVDIPSTYQGLPVRGIADNAAKNNTKLRKIKIPASVQAVGNYAFYGCSNLKTVTLAEGNLFHLGTLAFANTPSITNLNLPSCLQYIHSECFRDSSVLSLCTNVNRYVSVLDGWVLTINTFDNEALELPGNLKYAEWTIDSVTNEVDFVGIPSIINNQPINSWPYSIDNVILWEEVGAGDMEWTYTNFIGGLILHINESDLGQTYNITIPDNVKLCRPGWFSITEDVWVDDCAGYDKCIFNLIFSASRKNYYTQFLPYATYEGTYYTVNVIYQ